jgi:diguanylate cyclase (GGDEF)-like protein
MSSRIAPWLRASLQGTTVLGITMIVLIWTAAIAYLDAGRETDLKAAAQRTWNLARVIEEHIARTIHGIDNALVILRAMYEVDNKSFGYVDWASDAQLAHGAVLHFSIIDAAGRLVDSSRKPIEPLDLSDREHFIFQRNNASDELFIGRPVEGIRTGKQTIQLARRLRGWDGSFAGEIVASLDTTRLIQFYQEIDIGREGSISLIGLDGYVRARRGFKNENIVKLPPNRGVLVHLAKAPAGTYMNDGKFDGVHRLISYRKVTDYPLAVVVGLARDEILAGYYVNRVRYYGLAAGITALVLIVMALSVSHHRKLDLAYASLRRNEIALREKQRELRTTLDNIDEGILMADAKGNIGLMNRRLTELLDLPQDWLRRRATLSDLISYLTERGEYGKDGSLLDKGVWDIVSGGGMSHTLRRYERTRPNGRVLEIHANSLPDGGMVRTFTDITERKQAEARIAVMATHDDLTGLANRTLFRDRLGQALSRAQRHGERFALLLLDLDRFKDINDSRGHLVGDAVLKEAAQRLSRCIREHDMVARLGGDEFAILQADARTDEDVALLAQRIIRSLRTPFTLDNEDIALAASIGIVLAPRDGADYETLVKKADQALYRAKDAGSNFYCFARNGAVLPVPPAQVVDLERAAS